MTSSTTKTAQKRCIRPIIPFLLSHVCVNIPRTMISLYCIWVQREGLIASLYHAVSPSAPALIYPLRRKKIPGYIWTTLYFQKILGIFFWLFTSIFFCNHWGKYDFFLLLDASRFKTERKKLLYKISVFERPFYSLFMPSADCIFHYHK